MATASESSWCASSDKKPCSVTGCVCHAWARALEPHTFDCKTPRSIFKPESCTRVSGTHTIATRRCAIERPARAYEIRGCAIEGGTQAYEARASTGELGTRACLTRRCAIERGT